MTVADADPETDLVGAVSVYAINAAPYIGHVFVVPEKTNEKVPMLPKLYLKVIIESPVETHAPEFDSVVLDV